jgi:26S proteasome regulatory subunit N2
VEMKSEESKLGDISPIGGSASNLPEDGKATSKQTRKTEPSFERLPNFSRVTPGQLAHITFPSEGRYQPVRTISMKPSPLVRNGKGTAIDSATNVLGLTTEKYAGGGGILILTDLRPDEEVELVELEAAAAGVPALAGDAAIPNGEAISDRSNLHMVPEDDGPEADPPESFEVCLICFWVVANVDAFLPTVSFRG